MGLLHSRGATITYADPYVPEIEAREWSGRIPLNAVNVSRGSFAAYDCIVVVTDHRTFDYTGMVAEADLIVDTRNAIKTSAPNVFKLGAPRPEGENALA
jgi:UDP-N-acetyl-D-glucosamine dehydrogenase